MAIGGAGLFVAGQIGSFAGVRILPFDQHHVFSQIAGFLLAVTGLSWVLR